jgi:hypothetical protein
LMNRMMNEKMNELMNEMMVLNRINYLLIQVHDKSLFDDNEEQMNKQNNEVTLSIQNLMNYLEEKLFERI